MINIADLLLENNTASERPNNDNPIVDYSDNHEKIDNDTKVEDNEPLEESKNNISFSRDFKYVKNIVDSLSEKDLYKICNGDFKKSPYVKYREVVLLNNDPVSFIEVYTLPSMNKRDGVIVIATKDKYRSCGYANILINRMKSKIKNIDKLIWKTDMNNINSRNLAKKNGFFNNKEDAYKDKKIEYAFQVNESVEKDESLDETYIASKKDIEYKLDSWKKGSNNILLITGLSGSGKSTRASQLSKEYNAINFELDLFEHNSILFSNNYNHDEANIIMKDIFKKMYGGKKNFDKYSDEDYRKEFVKFFKNLLSYCKSHKDQLFIIEGLQIFKHVAYYDISIIENTPIIIIGVSLTKSLIRRYKRDHNTSDGSFKHPIQLMKKYIEWEKSLNNLRNSDYLKESSNNSDYFGYYVSDEGNLNENVISESTLYRYTYDGIGVYEALRKKMDKLEWESFLNSRSAKWLPKPPKYENNYYSYFTKEGMQMFKKYTLPVCKKYLGNKINMVITDSDEKPIYKDKYQVILSTDYYMEATAVKSDGSMELVSDEKNTNNIHESVNGTELSDLPKINSKYLENKDDIYNIKNWTPDKYNILFITGMSGSGKTTLGEDLAKINKCQRVELDYIVYYFLNRAREKGKQQNTVNKLKKDCPDAAKFFTTERDAKYHLESWGDHTPVTKEFLDWFIHTHEGDGNLYIINGAQIPDVLDHDFFKERPIIIKDPNLVKNVTRRTMRESKFSNYDSFSGWIRGFGRHIKLYTSKGYRDSLKRLKKFSNNIDNIHESVDGTELYPVYIVTSYTDTKFGKIIRKASDCYYTHAAISFESDLHEMYSFGNSGTLSNSKLGGMTCESLNDYINTSKNAVILVSVVFVKEKDYKKLLAFFDEYLNNSRNTRYSYSNLFNVLKNKPISNTPSLSYICSQFVDSLFKFISIDMTDKPSNLVTPEDIANLHNVKPTVYKLFEGKAIDYNVNRIEKILDKMYNKAKPIKEVTLLEAKEFPIQFNDEGDLLISKKEKIDFLAEYNKSKKLRQSYVKYKNLEGLKYECCKMWYINTILMKLLDDKNLSHSDREDYNNYRSKILTEFSQYLKEIQKIDKSFNFGSFYETTPFSNTKIKINGSTIKYTTKLMKFIFK